MCRSCQCHTDNQRAIAVTSEADGGGFREYTVSGLACGHCVVSVRDGVSELAGVRAVDVDLASGRLTVTGDVYDDAVRNAVVNAGYEVV